VTVGKTIPDTLTDPARFASENEPIPVFKSRLPEGSFALAGEEPHPCPINRSKKRLIIVVKSNLKSLPVIHATALEISIAEHKPKRPDQVKRRPGGDAQTAYITSIWGDFRLQQGYL